MSIAEKLQTIVENEQRVFEAGRNSAVDPDKIIKVTATGTGSVYFNDVSEVKHDVKVKIIAARRKNLFPNFITDKTYANGSFIKVNEDGSITVHKIAGDVINIKGTLELEEDVYTLSGGETAGSNIYIEVKNVATGDRISTSATGGKTTKQLKKGTYQLSFYSDTNKEIDVIFYPQLEKGTVATPYTPYIESVEGLKVKTYGKNLLSDAVYDVNNWVREEGISINSTYSKVYYLDEIPNGTYTISAMASSVNVYLYCYYSTDNGETWMQHKGSNNSHHIIAGKNAYSHIIEKTENTRFLIWHNNIKFAGDIDYIQIEVGTTATAYEPFKIPTEYTADENGNVTIASISPNINIFTEGEFSVEYRRSWGMQTEYDRFWDALQSGGLPSNYAATFGAAWTEETFCPKYDLVPINAYMMFRQNQMNIDLVEHLEKLGVVLDTSQCDSFSYMFSSSKFTRIGVIDLSGSTQTLPGDAMFMSCTKLVTIDKIILKTGTRGEFGTGCFNACSALENIVFEGVITQNGLNLQWSTKLSHDSLMSAINCLEDKSTDTSGKEWLVTLGDENLAKLTAAEQQIAYDKGWVLG